MVFNITTVSKERHKYIVDVNYLRNCRQFANVIVISPELALTWKKIEKILIICKLNILQRRKEFNFKMLLRTALKRNGMCKISCSTNWLYTFDTGCVLYILARVHFKLAKYFSFSHYEIVYVFKRFNFKLLFDAYKQLLSLRSISI